MPHPENPSGAPFPEGVAGALPPELAEYLRGEAMCCLMQETTLSTAFVIKLPRAEIESLRGTIPIAFRNELYQHPAAPVIRSLLTFYDQPETPLALETFTNVADPEQRADFARLSRQRHTTLLFYDEGLGLHLTKQLGLSTPADLRRVLRDAERARRAIPPDRYDFDRAKAAVVEVTRL